MNKKILFSLAVLLMTLVTQVTVNAQVVTINGGSTTGNGPLGSNTFHCSEHIFLQTEINNPVIPAPLNIQFMRFNMSTIVGNPMTFANVSIYLRTTTAAIFTVAGTYPSTAGYTLVYSGPMSWTTTGFQGVTLTTPFTYSNAPGTNLQMMVIRTNSSGNAGHIAFSANTGPINCRRYNAAVAGTPGVTAMGLSAFRAAVQFGVLPVANDAAVTNVYTLGKMPIEYGAPTIIQANVSNTGTTAMTSLPVTLNISGTNSFSDIQTIASLAPGANAVVSFASYAPAALSTNDVVNVSIPADAVNSNNSASWNMNVTPNVYTYKNPAQANAGGVGFNGVPGDFVAKFNSNIGQNFPYNVNNPAINEIKVDFTTTGQPYNVGIWDATGIGGTPGTLLWTSPNLTSAVGTAIIPVPDVSVSGDYFVGVKQTGIVNVGFAYQSENPIRSGTFYFNSATPPAINWIDFAPVSPFRFSIEVSVHIPVPPNCATDFSPVTGSVVTCANPTLSWANGGGGPTSYDVYLGTVQADVANLDPGTLVSASQVGTTYAASLLPLTTYYWNIIPKNIDGDAINCTVQSFTTGNLPNCYCIPVYTTFCNTFISDVQFNTISNPTGCAAPGYTLYPNSGSTTTAVDQGGTYNLSVTSDAASIISVWIDYNQNGVFDTTEWSQVTLASVANAASTFPINIPLSALTGNTLMRVRSRITANANAATDACTIMGSGETEDYIITINPQPACAGMPVPGNTVSSVANYCANAAPSATLSLPSLANASGYTYQWVVADDLAFTMNPTNLGTASTQTYALTTGTKYFRCLVTCTNGSQSDYSTPVMVTENPLNQCYCIPAYTSGISFGDLISEVQILGTTLLNNTGTATTPNISYTYYGPPTYTATNYTASLAAGTTYNLQVTIGSFEDQGVAAWIDYNDDGVYAPAEKIGNTPTQITTAFGSATFPISLACNPTPGPHRMRVRCVYFTNGPVIDPCLSYGFGEAEDYLITITPPPPCPSPSNLVASNVSQTSFDLSWTIGCTETSWNVEYGVVGYVQGTGTTVPVTTTPTTSISGLNCSSSYDVYVQANCAGNGTSTWIGPITVSTACCTAPGQTFANPIIIGQAPCATSPYTHAEDNTLCYTNSYAGTNNQGSNDVWYQFTLSSPATVELGLCNSTFDTYMHLLDNTGANIVSNDDAAVTCGTGLQSFISQSLAAGTYYIVTEGFGTATGNLDLSVNTTDPCSATLNLKAFIQGYYVGAGAMTSAMANSGLPNPTTECDAITVELNEGPLAAVPYTVGGTFTGNILTDGTLACTYPGSVIGGSYYIKIISRNGVETWSTNPITIASTNAYDFTTAQTQAFGGNQVEVETGVWAIYSGDINQDFAIDGFDYLLQDPDVQNGNSGYLTTDLNGDGTVDSFDYLILDPNINNGITASIP